MEINGIFVQGDGKILFVHGAGLNSNVWKNLLSLGFAVDLPGHGKSVARDIKSLKDYAEVLVEVVERLETPIIAGHSMGGAVVQEYLRIGGKAEGVVLISTGARLPVNPKILESLKQDFEGTVDKLVNWMFHKDFENKIVKKFVKDIILNTGVEITLRDLYLCSKFDLTECYPEIEIPTLIIVGNEDVMTPPYLSEYLREKIPKSRLSVIHDAGHMVFLEKPNETNIILREFLKDVLNS
uniref:Alpha/beta hydrolase n=1 Tax=Geoglobus ahangari TaxID=113653 RepID=A0A7C4S5C3_9EURY